MKKLLQSKIFLSLLLFNPILHASPPLPAENLQYSISPITSQPLISTNINLRDINDSGQIVGSYSKRNSSGSGSSRHAFISSEINGNRVMTDIGSLGGNNGSSFAYGINNLGQIVGKSSIELNETSTSTHAFVAESINNNWVMTDLTPILNSPSIDSSSAYSIGDTGDIVGSIYYKNPVQNGENLLRNIFIAEKNENNWAKIDFEISVPVPLTHNFFSINNRHQIVGTLGTRSAQSMRTSHIVSKENTQWNTLTTDQFSSDRLVLEGLNDNNQIVGYNQDAAQGGDAAFIATFNDNNWSITDLGIFDDESTRASDINNTGLAVGMVIKRVGTRLKPIKAILFFNGQTHDLKTLITEGAEGWSSLNTASAINNKGQVIGYGTYNGVQNTPFLMTQDQQQFNAPTCKLGADPQKIKKGEGSALWWWSDAVASANIDNTIGSISTPSGFNWTHPTKTTTYTMTAKGQDGTSTTCQTTIIVEGQVEESPPACEIGADPQTIKLGEGSALWWWTDNASSANIDNGVGSVNMPSDYTWFYPTQTKTYTMNVANDNGTTASCKVTINVIQ
ncbi:MAG: hypothetical protein KAH20_05765 [Methylococcales bacterium]|nr:hypothetical protein [Methylococcales bacterium]